MSDKADLLVAIREAIAQEFAALKEAKALAESAAATLDDCAGALELLENPRAGPEHLKLHKMNLRKKAALIREGIRHVSKLPEPSIRG